MGEERLLAVRPDNEKHTHAYCMRTHSAGRTGTHNVTVPKLTLKRESDDELKDMKSLHTVRKFKS